MTRRKVEESNGTWNQMGRSGRSSFIAGSSPRGMEMESHACKGIPRTGIAIRLLGFGLSLLVGATAWGGSPIQNPGFEAVDGDGQPVVWRGGVSHHAGKTYTGSAVADAEVVRSGRYSARGKGMLEQGPVRVKPRTRYRLSVWMLMPNRGWPLLEVRGGEGKRVLANNNFGGDGIMNPWTRFALEFDTGEHSEITVRAGYSVADGGPYWLDDFELVEDPSIRLGNLTATDPAPEASADEVAQGYVVFSRHWMDRVSSAAKPGAGERTESLSLRLTPGEYGPLTVAVYALNDLQDLQVTPAGPLSGPGGYAISPEHVDVRAASMSRISFSSTQWEEYPLFLPPAKPAELKSDATRLFWITVRTPEDAPAGVYRGAVRVNAGNAAEQQIPLSVEVLPFRLLVPPVSFAMYPGGDGDKHQLRRYYEDLKAHGMTGAMHFGYIGTRTVPLDPDSGHFNQVLDNQPWSWQEQMETLVDVGLPAAGFPVVTFNMKNFPPQGGQSYSLFKQHRRSGWPELRHYVQDEIGGAKIPSAKWLLGFYTHPDIRKVSTTTVWELGRLYDEWIAYYSTVADPESEVLKRARRWGRDVGVYECVRGGNNPVFDRYFAGLYTWKTGIKSNWIWIYIWGESKFALSSPDGPVPTVGWEGRREGIDDYRYLHTLDVMARKAAVSDGFGPENALVRESFALLDSIGKRIDAEGAFRERLTNMSAHFHYSHDPQPDMRSGDYDRMRAQVSDQILKLHTAGIRVDEAAGAPGPVAAETTAEERRLHEAAVKGDLEMAAGLLAGGVDVNARDEAWRWTPLHHAAKRGHAPVVELFLKAGADQTARDRMGWTPLQVAAERGHLPVVELLLKAGSEPDMLDERGRTPLMYAAYTNRLEVARTLLERGAKVNAADDDGHAVLHWAVFNYQAADMARLLLERGAEVDAAGREGMTALHWAARQVHGLNSPAAKVLLEAGAARDPRDAHGWTPLHWAVLMGDVDGVKTKLIKLLLEGGADANVGDEDGRTPLHFTAHMEGDHSESAGLLLERGADVTIRDKDGNTSLHLAAARGHAGLCVMLLKNNANVNARNAAGLTPLHLAAREIRPEATGVLLAHGAARDLRDNEGKTPLEYLLVEGDYGRLEQRAEIRSHLTGK